MQEGWQSFQNSHFDVGNLLQNLVLDSDFDVVRVLNELGDVVDQIVGGVALLSELLHDFLTLECQNEWNFDELSVQNARFDFLQGFDVRHVADFVDIRSRDEAEARGSGLQVVDGLAHVAYDQ